jgi:predicted nucleic acid-binding protein
MGKFEKRLFMILIADSSALIALAVCDSLPILEKIFKEVKVPQAVFDEVIKKSKKQAEILEEYLCNKVIKVDLGKHIIIKDGTLEKGELEAMALYKDLVADRLLIDDKRARKIAELNGINTIGSLGVLLLAKEKGVLTEIKSKIEIIRRTDIFFSEELLEHILKIANE